MYISLAVHHSKGPKEKADLMARQQGLAEVNSKHKGFVQMVVAEVEDENLVVPFTIWESEDDYRAALADAAKHLFSPETVSFLSSVQEGPTRVGGSSFGKETIITTFKVAPVKRPQLPARTH